MSFLNDKEFCLAIHFSLIYYYLMKINFGPDTGGKSMGITSGKPKKFSGAGNS